MGHTWSVLAQMWPPAPAWTTDDIPDLSGKVMIVTGGNSGCGYETVKALLNHNAKVYLAARNPDKAQAAISQLKEETGKEALYLHLDLADLASVRASAQEFLSKEPELHVLFNNAAVMACPVEDLTKQGYDMQFGCNVLGHFLFTELLMPALLNGVASSPDKKARVITTSSSGAYLCTLDWSLLEEKDSKRRRSMDPMGLYYQSKHANVIVACELARRYGDKGIVSNSVNPGMSVLAAGNLKTGLQRHIRGSGLRSRIIDLILYPAPFGALTQLWAGTSPETVDLNGEFLIPWARLGKMRPECHDPESGRKLWEWLDEQSKDYKSSP